MAPKIARIGMIGFGEAGGILGAEFAALGLHIATYDILVASPETREPLAKKAAATRVHLCATLAEALAGSQLVVSAVTAASAQEVAQECARMLRPGQWFLDINSISPRAKQENARVVAASGALYIEAAVMAPVPPQRLRVPMLLGGEGAGELAEQLRSFGMNANAVSANIGVASAIKMCRSIMIKGMEALTVECLFAARRYGAEDAVLESLHASFPSLGWNADFPNYLVSRVAEHGRRRAAEMREVARTVGDVALKPLMAEATAERQDALVDAMQAQGIDYDATKKFSWRQLADRLAETSR